MVVGNSILQGNTPGVERSRLGLGFVLCMVMADRTLEMRVPQADGLRCVLRRVANVLMQDTGAQALMGQAFLGVR